MSVEVCLWSIGGRLRTTFSSFEMPFLGLFSSVRRLFQASKLHSAHSKLDVRALGTVELSEVALVKDSSCFQKGFVVVLGQKRPDIEDSRLDFSFQELKYATADLLELPPRCHRLLCGGEIMASEKRLKYYGQQGTPLEVMVVISHELIYKRMGDPDDLVRQAALNTLGRAAEPGSKAWRFTVKQSESWSLSEHRSEATTEPRRNRHTDEGVREKSHGGAARLRGIQTKRAGEGGKASDRSAAEEFWSAHVTHQFQEPPPQCCIIAGRRRAHRGVGAFEASKNLCAEPAPGELKAPKALNRGMESELSFLRPEIQRALFKLHTLEQEVQRLRAAELRRRRATNRQRRLRQNKS